MLLLNTLYNDFLLAIKGRSPPQFFFFASLQKPLTAKLKKKKKKKTLQGAGKTNIHLHSSITMALRILFDI